MDIDNIPKQYEIELTLTDTQIEQLYKMISTNMNEATIELLKAILKAKRND